MASAVRKQITAAEAGLSLDNPLARSPSIRGVIVHDVGQGDAISVIDGTGRCVLRLDYGGLQSSPFKTLPGAKGVPAIDKALPVARGAHLMFTHWDEDHWSSARKGTQAVNQGGWLVPRQWTSPRAVKRSAALKTVHCVPETLVGSVIKFEARNGDAIWWEKLKPFDPLGGAEDCNHTGVALSVTAKDQVIFLPGDAPYHRVRHYDLHRQAGRRLRGLVAFHHGAGTKWTKATETFLKQWSRSSPEASVVFSCGDPNSYGHPDQAQYEAFFAASAMTQTPIARTFGKPSLNIDF